VKVDTRLASGVTVTANHNGTLKVDDRGTTVIVPSGATLVVSAAGIVTVMTRSAGAVSYKIALPKGTNTRTFAFRLPNGVSFGRGSAVQTAIGAYTTSGKRGRWTLTKVSRGRGELWFTTDHVAGQLVCKLNVVKLDYTAAETAYLKKHKPSTITPWLIVTPTRGGSAMVRIPIRA
jgi:hypothetical protein